MRIYEDNDMDAPSMGSAKEALDALVEELKTADTSTVLCFVPSCCVCSTVVSPILFFSAYFLAMVEVLTFFGCVFAAVEFTVEREPWRTSICT